MAIKKAKVDVQEDVIVWEFANGETYTVRVEDFHPEVQKRAMVHGFKQKLSDCYAGAKTVAIAEAAFSSLLESLQVGNWNQGRNGLGGIWVEALAKAAGCSLEEAGEKWKGMDEEEQKELKAHKGIKLAKAQIEMAKAERAAEDVDGMEDLPEFLKVQAG